MLRKKVRLLLTDKKYRDKLRLLARLVILVGLLWLVSFPYMSRAVFTSENALNGRGLTSDFAKDAATSFSVYKRI